MSLTELLPSVRTLSHKDKLRLLQVLVKDVTQEGDIPLSDYAPEFAIWSPYAANEAASVLAEALKADKASRK